MRKRNNPLVYTLKRQAKKIVLEASAELRRVVKPRFRSVLTGFGAAARYKNPKNPFWIDYLSLC
ncbi:MAG: hypothetical protein LBP89_05645 [Helicobacteraceae bacterium]|nr:hypothetical protein [Helicobacteraceae bacterium]